MINLKELYQEIILEHGKNLLRYALNFVVQCASECSQVTRPDPVLHGDRTHVPGTAQTRARSGDLLLFIDVVMCHVTIYRCTVACYYL